MALLWMETYTPQLAALFSEAVAAGADLRARRHRHTLAAWDRAYAALVAAIGDEDFSYQGFGSPR